MSAQQVPRLTPEEYLEIERKAEYKSEYYRGVMYAMAGGSYGHALIIGNLTGELRTAMKTRPCAVCPTELRLRVSPDGLYTYPDIMVICGPPKFSDGERDMVENPVLIVEVLSPSTEAHDRGLKFAQYRAIESLQEYVMVSQSEARVERFRRQPGGAWLLEEFIGLEAEAVFASVECRIPMSEIYAKVPFGG